MVEAGGMGGHGTQLVLVRHGQSQAQVDGFVSGHDTCRGLSPLGHRQAEALRDRLATTGELAPVDALYTSILPRAMETAATIAPPLGAARSSRLRSATGARSTRARRRV